MKQYLLLIILAIIFISCSNVNNSTSFSRSLYKMQKEGKECGIYPKLSLSQRNEVLKKINFINYSNDTVYYLESYYIETGTTYSAIWTNSGKVEYKGEGKSVEMGNDYFIKRLYTMIEKWDTATIKIEEKKSISILGRSTIIGARMILEKDKVNIQCIKFLEFFDVHKDS